MPESQSLESWLQQWERIVAKCVQQKLPETEGVRPQRDFLRAIHGQYAEFVVPIIRDLEEEEEETLLQARAAAAQQPSVSKKLELQRILQQFRNYRLFANPMVGRFKRRFRSRRIWSGSNLARSSLGEIHERCGTDLATAGSAGRRHSKVRDEFKAAKG